MKTESPDTPFIVISGASVMNDVVEALRLGANDYLIKPIIDLAMLEHSVIRNLERTDLIEQNQAYKEDLERNNVILNERLKELKNDQQAGRHVQQKMLPESPLVINNIHFSQQVIPSLLLSGDFADYFKINETQSIFYIADVSGHGASSAFVTVLLKNLTSRLLRNYRRASSDDILYPDKILHRTNIEVLQSGLGKHLTMFVGLIDHSNNQLSYSVGGHLPMPGIKENGVARMLRGRGMPVGLFSDAEYETQHIQLKDDFSITLYSDGVLEILKQRSLQEKEAFLVQMANDNPVNISSIFSALGLSEINDTPDDIAMMTISRMTETNV
jgi:serine phosphatase RsbU (regulator of sigma subunit)